VMIHYFKFFLVFGAGLVMALLRLLGSSWKTAAVGG